MNIRETREDLSRRGRQERYWRSLLSMKPTGNAMVDAGFHEEMRCALRDALHVIQDLSCANKTLERLLNSRIGERERKAG
ncbi:hypothetical protein [Acidithiobacillus sulfuriphilus]|uniref:hypothetical protein n=1 Tax=Acidithiobacillus sulfuriphilus TaxID=1867749 RepID=UPI003F632344